LWEIVCQAKGKVIDVERRKSGMVVTIFVVLTVAAIVLVVILRNMMNRNEGEEMDVSKYADRGITKAYMIADEDGELEAYDVFVTVPGYKSDIETKVRIEKDGDELLDLQILSQDETPELGGKIVEGSFLNQFKGKELPVTLSGQEVGNGAGVGKTADTGTGRKDTEGATQNRSNSEGSLALSGTGNVESTKPGQEANDAASDRENAADTAGQSATTENNGDAENTANSELGGAVQRVDGVYRAEGEEFGGNRSQVTMIIENGEITELHWDSFDAEGNGKRALSLQGKYTMTEDGLLWADQADAVQKYVIEHQGLNGLTTNEEGKTDVVSGVSISIASFKELVKECLAQATVGGTENNTSNGNSEIGGNADNIGNNVSNGSSEGNGSVGSNNANTEPASKVDGVSGATISSTAVVQAVQIAYEFVLEQGR